MKNAFLLLLSLAVLGASPASARLRRPGVLHAELWLGNYEEKGRHWDMIQFNHGLHDLKQVYDNQTDTFGAYAVPNDNKSQSARAMALRGACLNTAQPPISALRTAHDRPLSPLPRKGVFHELHLPELWKRPRSACGDLGKSYGKSSRR